MLDSEDRRMLRYLQADPTLSQTELAERCGTRPGTISRRLTRLEAAGVVQGTEAVIDWAALGYRVQVSLRLTLDKTQADAFDAFLAAARKVPEVLEIQTFLGRVDVRLLVIATSMGHYQEIYRRRILTLPHIAEIEALMHVARIKTDETLPL